MVRIIIRELNSHTKEHSEQLQLINQKYGASKEREMRNLRNEEISAILDKVKELQRDILDRYREKMESIFQDIGFLLSEMLDLEKRNEVGLIAHQVFSTSLIELLIISE